MADPGHALIKYTIKEFCNHWISLKKDGQDEGIVLMLDPTPNFYENDDGNEKTNRKKLSYVLRYLKPYKHYVFQLFLGLFLGSLFKQTYLFNKT